MAIKHVDNRCLQLKSERVKITIMGSSSSTRDNVFKLGVESHYSASASLFLQHWTGRTHALMLSWCTCQPCVPSGHWSHTRTFQWQTGNSYAISQPSSGCVMSLHIFHPDKCTQNMMWSEYNLTCDWISVTAKQLEYFFILSCNFFLNLERGP